MRRPCLDVAFVAARTRPTRRSIPPTGALLDDLLLVCGIGPLLQADLSASPRLEVFATDASPSGAGACAAPVTNDLWRTLYRRTWASMYASVGAALRLYWNSRLRVVHVPRSSRPADWSVLFEYRFRAPDHTNVRELTALTSLRKHLPNRGAHRQRILCCVDSRVVLGAVSKGRSLSGRLNCGLGHFGTRMSQCVFANRSIYWVRSVARDLARQLETFPTWRLKLQVSVSGQPAVARELKLLREPLSVAAVRELVLAVIQNRDAL